MRVSAFPGLLCRKSGNMSVSLCVNIHAHTLMVFCINICKCRSIFKYVHLDLFIYTHWKPWVHPDASISNPAQRFFLSFSHVFVTLFSSRENLVSATPLTDALFIPLLSLLYQTLCRCLLTPGGLRSPPQITAPTPTGQLPCSPPT